MAALIIALLHLYSHCDSFPDSVNEYRTAPNGHRRSGQTNRLQLQVGP